MSGSLQPEKRPSLGVTAAIVLSSLAIFVLFYGLIIADGLEGIPGGEVLVGMSQVAWFALTMGLLKQRGSSTAHAFVATALGWVGVLAIVTIIALLISCSGGKLCFG